MKDRGMENVLFDALKEEKYVGRQSAKLNFLKSATIIQYTIKGRFMSR